MMEFGPMTNHALLRCWLFDAAALSPPELDQLRQAPLIRFIYDHLKDDDRAQSMGPLLVAQAECSDQVAKILSLDHRRHWAVHQWHFRGSWGDLMRHASSLKYLQTSDSQRYYLRFADSRCLPFVWSVLTARQQASMMGSIDAWHYLDRAGQSVQLSSSVLICQRKDAEWMTDAGPKLSDDQLGKLLELIWPDQLLSSVMEESQDLVVDVHSHVLFNLSSITCAWLRTVKEERYPVQKALLASLLACSAAQPDVDSVHQHLVQAHAGF